MSHSRGKLPTKHVVGLVATAVFITSCMSASVVATHNQKAWNAASSAAHAELMVDMTIAMTDAMMENKREDFIAFGSNKETQDKLARFWDDTKLIGWEVGGVLKGTVDANETLDWENSISFIMQLGTDARQLNPDPEGKPLALTTNIDYAVTFSDKNQKISSLDPVIPMPWDTEEGTYIEKRDNVTLYGFQSDAQLIRDHIDSTSAAATKVVTNSRFPTEATYGRVSRVAVFITSDQEQYERVIDRKSGGELGDPNAGGKADWRTHGQGLTIVFPDMVAVPESPAFINAAIGGRGVNIVINATDATTNIAEVVAHEIGHLLFRTNEPPELIALEGSTNVVNEGYARYMDIMATGDLSQLRGQYILDMIDGKNIDALMSDAAFRKSETAPYSYMLAASYLYFVDQYTDYDLYKLMNRESGYGSLPFSMWLSKKDGIKPEDWIAWLQAG